MMNNRQDNARLNCPIAVTPRLVRVNNAQLLAYLVPDVNIEAFQPRWAYRSLRTYEKRPWGSMARLETKLCVRYNRDLDSPGLAFCEPREVAPERLLILRIRHYEPHAHNRASSLQEEEIAAAIEYLNPQEIYQDNENNVYVVSVFSEKTARIVSEGYPVRTNLTDLERQQLRTRIATINRARGLFPAQQDDEEEHLGIPLQDDTLPWLTMSFIICSCLTVQVIACTMWLLWWNSTG